MCLCLTFFTCVMGTQPVACHEGALTLRTHLPQRPAGATLLLPDCYFSGDSCHRRCHRSDPDTLRATVPASRAYDCPCDGCPILLLWRPFLPLWLLVFSFPPPRSLLWSGRMPLPPLLLLPLPHGRPHRTAATPVCGYTALRLLLPCYCHSCYRCYACSCDSGSCDYTVPL